MLQHITTKRDLRNWVDAALGENGTPEIIDAVTDYLQSAGHPPWGQDWSRWLAGQDVWHIATALQL